MNKTDKDQPTIRSSYKPTDSERDKISKVYTRKQFMAEARQEAEKQWDKDEKQYEALPESDAEDWQSDYFVPITTSIIESELAEMVDQTPQPLIIPREESDKAGAKIIKSIFDYTWDIGDGDIELYKILKDTLTYGTGLAQEYFLSVPRNIKRLTSYDPETGKETYTSSTMRDFDDSYMECVKLQDFYVDETARGLKGPKGARDCIRRYIMHIDDFRSQYKGPIWDPLGNSKYVVAGGDTNYYEYFKPPSTLEGNQVEVLWYWSKPDDELIIIANDVLIRGTPNPYAHKQLPFARAVDLMNPHKFYGKGEASLLASINKELNRLRRMRHDRLHLSIDQMFLVSSRELIDEAQLIARPHGKIEVDSMPVDQAVKPLVYPDTPSSSYMEEDRIKEDAIRVTGQDDRMQSVQAPGTATEAAILKESSLKRIRLKMKLVERDFLTQIGRLRVSNIQQFYSMPKIERIVGEKEIAAAKAAGLVIKMEGKEAVIKSPRTIPLVNKKLVRNEQTGEVNELPYKGVSFFTLNPDMLRGQYDVKIIGGSTLPISKPLLQSKVTEMVDRLLPLSLQPGNAYDYVKIMDKYIEVNEFDPDSFKREDLGQEVSPEQDQTAQLIELANIENEDMMKGEDIAPTPYATEGHSGIHIAFMQSQKFKDEVPLNDPRIQIFTKHVMGESMAMANEQAQGQNAQGSQGQGMGMMGQPPAAKPTMVNEAMPAKMTGNIENRPQKNGMGPATPTRSPFKGAK